MGTGKYFWLKLRDDFFNNDEIEWLEEAHGGEIVLFYLKLCTRAIRNNGLVYREVGSKRIAYSVKKLKELTKLDTQDKVNTFIKALIEIGLVEKDENGMLFLPKVPEMLGATTSNAERQKRYRERKKAQAATLKADEIKAEAEEDEEEEPEEEQEEEQSEETVEQPKKPRFKAPTLEEIQAYIDSKGYKVDAKFFYEYYSAMDWCDKGGAKVKNWKGRVVTWNRREVMKNELTGNNRQGTGQKSSGSSKQDKQKQTDAIDWGKQKSGWNN